MEKKNIRDFGGAKIEALLRVLGEHHKAAHGIPEADIQQKERSLGLSLPTVLRNYYKTLGQSPYITQGCNNQYEPLLLHELFNPEATRFYDGQGFSGLLSSRGIRDILRDSNS
ncbi:hypothetical protein [Paenibacillus solani]|uniref:hypothetical protein n=1 Tax=Paenibacillus solani TaxID=1705565 RepID=UPI003D268E44